MNHPNYANQGSSYPGGLTHANSNMTNYTEYEAEYEDDGVTNERNDALQVNPVDHLESMSKKPAHQRRFSVNSFPHGYQKPKNGAYWNEDEPVLDDEGNLIENPRFEKWSNMLQADLSEMSEKVGRTVEKIENGFKDEEYSYEDTFNNYSQDFPQYDISYLRTVLNSAYDGGVMWKKGEKRGLLSNSKWKQRYFRVELGGRDDVPKLYYFDSMSKVDDIRKASGAIRLTSTARAYVPQSPKKKTNVKMRNKKDLIVNAPSDKAPDTNRQFNLLCNTIEEAYNWQHAIEHIVTKQEEYQSQSNEFQMHNESREGHGVDGESEDEEHLNAEILQQEKDKAQAIHARGNGLFDAVVGEEATFIIEAVDPLTQERLDEDEASELQPLLYVTLMTVDPEELEEDDGEDDEEDDEKNIAKRDEQELHMSKLGKNHLHYDLHPEYDHDEGHFVVRYTVSRVADYRLKILREQHHIYGSPFHVVALPGNTYAKMCKATGNGVLFSNPRQLNTFTIEACDKMGNRKDVGGDQFYVEYEGPAIANGTKSEKGFALPIDNGDGTYTCKYSVDVEAARNMVRPFVSINVRIDDGSHFSQSTLDRFRMMSAPEMSHFNDFENGEGYEESVDKPEKVITRPAWYVHIKGSPFHVPIANSYSEAYPLGGAPGELPQNSPMRSPINIANSSNINNSSGQKSYENTSPLRKAQFEAMWARQQSATSRNGQLLHSVGSRFEGSPKASYEMNGDENLARLAKDNTKFHNTVHAEREAALAEREMKLREQEAKIRQQARQVDEQKARMDDQMNHIQRMGVEVNSAIGVGSVLNSPLGTPKINNNNISNSMTNQSPLNTSGTNESSALFARFSQPLHLVFKYYAGSAGGALTLEQYMRLGQDYDLYPTFLNKNELKKCFVEAARGHDTLVFTGFIDALRITAVVALSKKTFKSLYPTEASKVHVLLSLWGVGDPLKLEQLRSRHQQNAF